MLFFQQKTHFVQEKKYNYICALMKGYKMKYPIDKELAPFCYFAPPIKSTKLAGFLSLLLKTPRRIFRYDNVTVRREWIVGYNGGKIEVLFHEPKNVEESMPTLIYYHGGGFFFGASRHHYDIAKIYALSIPARVVFVQYRLAPKHPHPTPSEDCFAAYKWVYENAERLDIDKRRIGVGGDSAGGALAAAVCQMARDRSFPIPKFQMLIYPVTDRNMNTESNRLYTDTPMWNSRLSEIMWKCYLHSEQTENLQYASPMEANRFDGLPDAYLEVAEFDCLRDEGLAYAEALRKGGASVTVNRTVGTMHGFDVVKKAQVSRDAISARINALKEGLKRDDE